MAADTSERGVRSRLEVNFQRVLHEAQRCATGERPRDWTFEKWLSCRRVLVLYGSETGTAREVAMRVAREARARHYLPAAMPMAHCRLKRLTGLAAEEVDAALAHKMADAREHKMADGVFAPLSDKLDEVPSSVEEISNNSSMQSSSDLSEEEYQFLQSSLPPLVVIFVAATTGQGDDPENMRDFFKMLWDLRQNKTLLKGLKYGVIALGDSSYQKFNYAGKRLNNLVKILGGMQISSIALGDDQHDLGYDFVVDPWLKDLWTKMDNLYPMPEGIEPIPDDVLPPSRYEVKFVASGENVDSKVQDVTTTDKVASCPVGTNAENASLSKISKTEKLTSHDHFQDVRLIEFDVEGISVKHEPGDILMVQPRNVVEHVDEFMNLMKFNKADKFCLKCLDEYCEPIPKYILDQPCTIEEVVTNYFDIMSVPNRYFFELLHYFSTDEDEREKFLEFASAEGQQDLFDYCNRPKRSILEVLADFPHTIGQIPFEYLFDLIPKLKPRAYSIASSALMHPNRAQILMAVVDYKTILRRRRRGVCSNWLKDLKVGDAVHCWIKKGCLKFPDHIKVIGQANESVDPVVLIGPGTGCAPFRAYIQERVASGTHKNGPVFFFFGCRNSEKDHFFGAEMQELENNNPETFQYITAFSRDSTNKVYVQHRIRERSEQLWKLISQPNAKVYYAGNAKRIPIDVYEALTDVCQRGLAADDHVTANYMKRVFDKKYQTESWA